MKNTRLNEILSSLSREEFLKLNDYLHSSYLNKNKQVILFYQFLSAKNVHPDYSGVSRKEVFQHIYEDQEFNLDKYLKVSSDFVKTIENFLIYELRSGREFLNKRTLLEIAGSRNLPKTFSKYLGEINIKMKNEFNKDLDFYITEYESKVESMLYNLNSKKFSLENALLDINDTVNIMFAHSKLELMIKLSHIPAKKRRIFYETQVIDFIEKNRKYIEEYHPMLYLKSRILKMFQSSDAEIYQQIKTFLLKNEEKISKENLHYLYDKMITFCSMNESGELKSEEFEIIRALEKNSLIAGEEIDYTYFLRIIDTALNENDSYWAESFLKKYAEKIDSELRENTINLAMASICLYRQKFNEALSYVSKVESQNVSFYLSSKSLSLIIFYELNDTLSINYAAEAFETYLNRNKKRGDVDCMAYKTFLNLFKQLVSLKLKNRKSGNKNDFIKQIESHNEVLNKDWFIRKLSGIESGKRNN